MAQKRSFFDDVKNELECPVCQEQFSKIKEPKILKCLHTFCKICLEAWLRQQRDGELRCPTCRQTTECPDRDINKLPSNLFCKQLVEIVEAYSGEGQVDSRRCGYCDDTKPLKVYCTDCNLLLCEECVVAHRRWKALSEHHVKEIGNFVSSDVLEYARRANVCSRHNDGVRYYCENCQICICRDGAVLEHKDHNIISLDQGLENNKIEIETKMRTAGENRARLRHHRNYLGERRQEVNKSIEEATNKFEQVAEQCMTMICQHKGKVTERLTAQRAAFEDAISAQVASVDENVTEINNTLRFCEELLLRKNLPEILNLRETIEQRLHELSLSGREIEPKTDLSAVQDVPKDVAQFLRDALGKPDKLNNNEPAQEKCFTEGKVKMHFKEIVARQNEPNITSTNVFSSSASWGRLEKNWLNSAKYEIVVTASVRIEFKSRNILWFDLRYRRDYRIIERHSS